jgi:RpiR family carbohydrate utilization transcriptional regulator
LDKNSDLLDRIQAQYADLRKSEKVVADYLRRHSTDKLQQSITEFAKTLGVSDATVSRFSRALGYSGYPDLKLALAEASGSVDRNSVVNIPSELDRNDPLITLSAKLSVLLSNSILGTQKLLDEQLLEQCVGDLRSCDQVVLIGVGGAAAICMEAAHLFTKAGVDAKSYDDGYNQIVAAANMSKNSLMIGISHTGTTADVGNALTLARKNWASTIAITSDPHSLVGKSAARTLLTWNSNTPSVPLYGDFLEGRMSQLFLINMLYVGLIFGSDDIHTQKLKATAEALEAYYRHDRG